jgi:hypothetical protein
MAGDFLWRILMKKIGEHFFHGNLEYVVDEVNADGTCNAHLIKVHSDTPTTPTETPVKAVEEPKTKDSTTEPEKTSTRANSTTTKRTYTRRTTTKK